MLSENVTESIDKESNNSIKSLSIVHQMEPKLKEQFTDIKNNDVKCSSQVLINVPSKISFTRERSFKGILGNNNNYKKNVIFLFR